MFTVVRYSVMRSFSTRALIETTSAPVIPRSVLAASDTAAAAASAKPSVDEPMIVTTFATSAISAPFVGTPRQIAGKGRQYTSPPMFDTLSDKLQAALGDLRGRGRLDEEAISRAMREIRLALLEADVDFKVVKDFVATVRERALGADVAKRLTPGQQVVKIVHEELTALMGTGSSQLAFGWRAPAGLLLPGLPGSG